MTTAPSVRTTDHNNLLYKIQLLALSLLNGTPRPSSSSDFPRTDRAGILRTALTKRPYSTELQIWTPEKKREPSSSRRLDTSSFTLPADRFVDEKTRASGAYKATTDKYYHEPGTGRKFRSLVSIKRHLTGTDCHEIRTNVYYGSKSYVKPGSFMKTFQSKSDSQIVGIVPVYRKPYTPKHQVSIDQSKPFELPDGWFINRSIRRSGHSMGKVDMYYYERATGRVFRSLVDVQRYLADNYIEENTTLSKLFKPTGLIQLSESEENDDDRTSEPAIVPGCSYKSAYSDNSDDVLLKDLVRKCDGVPPKDTLRNADDIPLKDLVRKFADVPLNTFVRKSKDVPLTDLVQNADHVSLKGSAQKAGNVPPRDIVRKSDNVPLKHSVPKSPDARKTRKQTNKLASPSGTVFSSTARILPAIASNHPFKIKWVLKGPAGDDWSPYTGDTMVSESLKQEWAKMFVCIVGQKYQDGSSSDVLD